MMNARETTAADCRAEGVRLYQRAWRESLDVARFSNPLTRVLIRRESDRLARESSYAFRSASAIRRTERLLARDAARGSR